MKELRDIEFHIVSVFAIEVDENGNVPIVKNTYHEIIGFGIEKEKEDNIEEIVINEVMDKYPEKFLNKKWKFDVCSILHNDFIDALTKTSLEIFPTQKRLLN